MRPARRLTGQLVAFAATLSRRSRRLRAIAANAGRPSSRADTRPDRQRRGPRHHQRQHGAVHRSELHHQSPEASYFGSPGSGTPRLRREPVPARPAPPPILLHGSAVSQTNPSQRPSFSIAPTDPCSPRWSRDHRRPAGHRRKHRRHLQRLRRPDRHHARPFRDGDLPPVPHAGDRHLRQGADRHADPDARLLGGQFLTRVTADPCPACIDYLAFDFSCGTNNTRCTSSRSTRQWSGLHGPGLAGRPRQPEHADPADPGSLADRRLLLLPDLLQPELRRSPTAPSARGSTTPARARATTAPTPSRCRPRSASATPGTTSARRWRRARNESRAALRMDRRRRRWRSACSHRRQRGRPTAQTAETCVEGPRPAHRRLYPVQRDCWRYRASYTCVSQNSTDDCQPLRDRGCSQVDSRCMDTNPQGACMLYEQTGGAASPRAPPRR